MRFYQVTMSQAVLSSILIGLIIGCSIVVNTEFTNHKKLPIVERGSDKSCIRVLNFENGHAFNCNDVDVTLRQYRTAESK